MIENYSSKFNSHILSFLKTVENDFYITENNIRQVVKDLCSLKKLIKQSTNQHILIEKGDCLGVVLQWKSLGSIEPRYYVKIAAINDLIAEKLLTVLLWNTKKDLFVKVKKEASIMKLFKNKSFEFRGDRGKEVLLYKRYKKPNNDNKQHNHTS